MRFLLLFYILLEDVILTSYLAGYNFRYPNYYYDAEGVYSRDLLKVNGIRFIVLMGGEGRKFDIVSLVLNISCVFMNLCRLFLDLLSLALLLVSVSKSLLLFLYLSLLLPFCFAVTRLLTSLCRSGVALLGVASVLVDLILMYVSLYLLSPHPLPASLSVSVIASSTPTFSLSLSLSLILYLSHTSPPQVLLPS